MANKKKSNSRDEGVRIANPTSNQMEMNDYRLSDVQQVYKDSRQEGVSVNSWGDLENYIQERGDSQWHIKPGEAKAMVADIKQAEQHNEPFTENPHQAFDEIHKYRSQNQ